MPINDDEIINSSLAQPVTMQRWKFNSINFQRLDAYVAGAFSRRWFYSMSREEKIVYLRDSDDRGGRRIEAWGQ